MTDIQRMENTIAMLRKDMESVPEEFKELYQSVIEFDLEYLRNLKSQ